MSQRNENGNILLGMLLLVGMHILLGLLICLILFIISVVPTPISGNYNWLPLLFILAGIGISQLLYVVPVSLWLKSQRRFGLMKGVIIGAVITVLLNGGCWLFVAGVVR
jgi:hypothetical protein